MSRHGIAGICVAFLLKHQQHRFADRDNTILEVYWQGGRVAMTLGLDQGDHAGMDIFAFSSSASAGGTVHVKSVDVWGMRSIWDAGAEHRRSPESAQQA